MTETIGCSVCHRAIYAEHADAEGRCVLCPPAERARRAPPEAPRPAEQPGEGNDDG